MTVVVLGREPAIEAWLEGRRAQGLDSRDEMWVGVLHVAPHEHGRNGAVAMDLVALLREPARRAGLRAGGSFNLGGPDDFRVPDLGWHRGPPDALFFPTAALVVEVLSPGDETFAKFAFYAERGVEELWVVDPLARGVQIWLLVGGRYAENDTSALLGLRAADVAAGIDWP